MTTMAERMFEEQLESKFNEREFEKMLGGNSDPSALAAAIVERIIEDTPDMLSGRPSMSVSMRKPTRQVLAEMEERIPGLCSSIEGDPFKLMPESVNTDMEFRFLPDGSGFCRISSEEYAVAAAIIDLVEPQKLFFDQPDISPDEYPAIIAAFKSVFNSDTGFLCMPFTPDSFSEIRNGMVGVDSQWKNGYAISIDGNNVDVAEFDKTVKDCLSGTYAEARNNLAEKLKNRH